MSLKAFYILMYPDLPWQAPPTTTLLSCRYTPAECWSGPLGSAWAGPLCCTLWQCLLRMKSRFIF